MVGYHGMSLGSLLFWVHGLSLCSLYSNANDQVLYLEGQNYVGSPNQRPLSLPKQYRLESLRVSCDAEPVDVIRSVDSLESLKAGVPRLMW